MQYFKKDVVGMTGFVFKTCCRLFSLFESGFTPVSGLTLNSFVIVKLNELNLRNGKITTLRISKRASIKPPISPSQSRRS